KTVGCREATGSDVSSGPRAGLAAPETGAAPPRRSGRSDRAPRARQLSVARPSLASASAREAIVRTAFTSRSRARPRLSRRTAAEPLGLTVARDLVLFAMTLLLTRPALDRARRRHSGGGHRAVAEEDRLPC